MDNRHALFDGYGRMLGLSGIVAALGTAFFSYSQLQELKSQIATLESKSTQSNSSQDYEARFNQLAEEWKASDEKIRQVVLDLEGQLALDQKLQKERDQTFQTFIAKSQTVLKPILDEATEAEQQIKTAQEMQSILNAPQNAADQSARRKLPANPPSPLVTETGDDQEEPETQSKSESESQRVVSYKPILNSIEGTALVINKSSRPLQITGIRFKPRRQLESNIIRGPRKYVRHTAADKLVVVSFSPRENTATETGRHDAYVREFSQPEVIEPNEQVQLRLEIENPEHLGWEFEGDLELESKTGEKFTVQAIRVEFVDESA